MKRKYINKLWHDRQAQIASGFKKKNSFIKVRNHNTFHLVDYHKSDILSIFLRKSCNTSVKEKHMSTVVNFKVPQDFSITKFPLNALLFFNEVVIKCQNFFLTDIVFDYSNCINMDLSASTLLDIILMEIHKCHSKKINVLAKVIDSSQVADMLRISGMIKHLKLERISDNSNNICSESSIEHLDLIRNESSDTAATKVVDYICKCLNTSEYDLSDDGKNKLSQMIGEVVDNCSLHSGTIDEWYTIGYFYKDKNENTDRCSISIIDFGDTISESISNVKDKRTKSSLKKLIQRHKPHFFKKDVWTEENLYTLYALQDGISCLKSEEEPDRGTGTITLIEGLQAIGRNKNGDIPPMTIVSGKTEIRFDGKYKLEIIDCKNGEQRNILSFNEKKSLKQPPDKNNVRCLETFFPGTIISMDFFIDKEYIESIVTKGQSVEI